MANVTKVMG